MRRIFFLLVVHTFLVQPTSPLGAENSPLSSVTNASKSVVHVLAEAGGLYKGASKAFIHKESGRLIVRQQVRPLYYKREGAGVILDRAGTIVTANHTVAGGGRITVILHDDSKAEGKVVYQEPEFDLALIDIEPSVPLYPVGFTSSEEIKLKMSVYSVGSSKFLRNTVSGGTVIGIGQSKKAKAANRTLANLLQVSFDVYHGDSSSPVLNDKGELIGLVVAGTSGKGKSSFAVTMDRIQTIYRKYRERPSSESAA